MAKHPDQFLRTVLSLDAATGAGAALLLLLGGGLLAAPLGLPDALLRGAGVAILPFVALLVATARQPAISSDRVIAIIAINFAWVAGSLFLMFGAGLAPTTAGLVFLGVQAAAVLLIAEAQIVGLRRLKAARTAFAA